MDSLESQFIIKHSNLKLNSKINIHEFKKNVDILCKLYTGGYDHKHIPSCAIYICYDKINEIYFTISQVYEGWDDLSIDTFNNVINILQNNKKILDKPKIKYVVSRNFPYIRYIIPPKIKINIEIIDNYFNNIFKVARNGSKVNIGNLEMISGDINYEDIAFEIYIYERDEEIKKMKEKKSVTCKRKTKTYRKQLFLFLKQWDLRGYKKCDCGVEMCNKKNKYNFPCLSTAHFSESDDIYCRYKKPIKKKIWDIKNEKMIDYNGYEPDPDHFETIQNEWYNILDHKKKIYIKKAQNFIKEYWKQYIDYYNNYLYNKNDKSYCLLPTLEGFDFISYDIKDLGKYIENIYYKGWIEYCIYNDGGLFENAEEDAEDAEYELQCEFYNFFFYDEIRKHFKLNECENEIYWISNKSISQNYSKIEKNFLKDLRKKIPNIIESYKIYNTNYEVDAYHQDTKTIYEFLGDYWHGNPHCYDHKINIEMKKRYDKTIIRFNTLIENGYNIKYIWEYDYRISNMEKIKDYIYST